MQLVANYSCSTGEGPLWHPDEELLYWVDIPVGCLYSYDPKSNSSRKILQSGQIGGFTIQTDGTLLLFMEKGAVRLLRDGKLTTIVDEIKGEEHSRFNDVIAAPDGSVFCGTMPSDKKTGSLYKLGLDKKSNPFAGSPQARGIVLEKVGAVSYTHLTLPTNREV